ncbi:sarcocystatin-A-like [Musca autumnalis]|uniref:sarcocystatin-A-like n=1 Tax=Musca autumnalis TaxID=221902 RepID=UPI003CE6D6A9
MNKLFALAIFAILFSLVNAQPIEGERRIVGGVRKLEGDDMLEAKEALLTSLAELTKGENGPNYKLGEIHSASKQVVSGILYKITADIIDIDNEEKPKRCDIKIWSQPWLKNGVKTTFNCEKEDELVFSYGV